MTTEVLNLSSESFFDLSGEVSYFIFWGTTRWVRLAGDVECLQGWGSGDDFRSFSSSSSPSLCAGITSVRLLDAGRARARSAWSFSGSLVHRSLGEGAICFCFKTDSTVHSSSACKHNSKCASHYIILWSNYQLCSSLPRIKEKSSHSFERSHIHRWCEQESINKIAVSMSHTMTFVDLTLSNSDF